MNQKDTLFKRSFEGGNISISFVFLCGWEASSPVMASVCRPVGPGGPAPRQPVFCTKAIVTLTTFIRVRPERTRVSLENGACLPAVNGHRKLGKRTRGEGIFFFSKWYPRDPNLMKINFCSSIKLGKHSSQNPLVKLT